MNHLKLLLSAAVMAGAFTACTVEKSESGQFIPETPDYGDSVCWYSAKGDSTGTGADVFYLVSTWEEDWRTEDGRLCRYADVSRAEHREHMDREISKVKDYMGEKNNFYAPYYRHMTIDIWATQSEDSVNSYFELSFQDVKAAFDHYINNENKGRPFVLMGFSQGGKAVVELLKAMDDSLRSRMVAAYVLGYKVTPADTAICPAIKPAMGPDDTGVTICYNSVRDAACADSIIAAPCAMSINPVSWRRDAEPAILHDTISVTLDTARNVLVLSGYSGSEYQPIRGFLNVCDIHSCEPWLYSECLKENAGVRVREWYFGRD